jgi:tetratricopeptide (TPR) repeat protein
VEPIDVEINLYIDEDRPDWRLEVRSLEPSVNRRIEPLTDSALANLTDLHPQARTWQNFLRALSPGGSFQPSAGALRAVGGVIRERVLGNPQVQTHLRAIEARAERESRPIRFLLGIDEEDPSLALLPLELAYDKPKFYFKHPGRPSFRYLPQTDARNLRLGPGSRALLVTAAQPGQAPGPETLAEHAEAVAGALRKARFVPEILPEPSKEELQKRILEGERVDLLSVIGHGTEAPDEAGRLALRDGSISGLEMAKWLEEAAEIGKPVQAVVLCSCSLASALAGQDTLGMAQWLVRRGGAVAALGFRGPVGVDWALRWAERVFEKLGQGAGLEEAFSYARYREDDAEPQWVLPVLYSRRCDPGAVPVNLPVAMPAFNREALPPLAPPPIERPPRSYFTGRETDLAKLGTWLSTPGRAQITSVHGQGGIGKTEIARVVAHEMRLNGRLVVWLERPDQDLAGALARLIQLREPGFQVREEGTQVEDLTAEMRKLLGAYAGLLVLDDVSDARAVDLLVPGGEWNVLVTSRIQGLLPDVQELEIEPLAPVEALRLLSKVAWNAEEPPEEEREGAGILIERLGRLPLALEIAGGTLRTGVTCREYLESLDLGEGAAAEDRERVFSMLTRSFRDLSEEDKRVFLALGALPAPGASGEMVADVLQAPAPRIARHLDRLVRHNLVTWSAEQGRYRLHPLLREAAQKEVEAKPDLRRSLLEGVAISFENLAEWVHSPTGHRTDMARQRWLQVRDLFDSLDLTLWQEGDPGGDRLAMALRYAHEFRADRTLLDREILLEKAEALSRTGHPWRQANVLKARGDLRRYRDDLEGASQEYDSALSLFEAVEDRLGQANVLKARGDLRRYRSDLEGASQDYDSALSLYEAIEDRLGQANVLQARGDLEGGRSNWEEAFDWYKQALPLYESVGSSVGLSNVLAEIAQILAIAGEREKAAEIAAAALELAQRCENRYALDLAGRVLEWAQGPAEPVAEE